MNTFKKIKPIHRATITKDVLIRTVVYGLLKVHLFLILQNLKQKNLEIFLYLLLTQLIYL